MLKACIPPRSARPMAVATMNSTERVGDFLVFLVVPPSAAVVAFREPFFGADFETVCRVDLFLAPGCFDWPGCGVRSWCFPAAGCRLLLSLFLRALK